MMRDIKVSAVNLVRVRPNLKNTNVRAGGGGRKKPNENVVYISSIWKSRDENYISQKNSCVWQAVP